MYTIIMGTHGNIEVSDGRVWLQGPRDSVFMVYEEYAEAGSYFKWVFVYDEHHKRVKCWTAEDGEDYSSK